MANDYFQFKEFRVEQGNTAMKVCTDSCIFGAYVQPTTATRQVLDIGTGTGLLSLMLAQQGNQFNITALEIDEAAYLQAQQNVAASPWAPRINVLHQAVQNFVSQASPTYDLIITNPPFFENHLKTKHLSQNRALHSEDLSFDELLTATDQLLAPQGTLAVLLPVYQMEVFVHKALAYGLHTHQTLRIHNHPKKLDFRMVCHFRRKAVANEEVIRDELFIRNAHNEYTPEFVDLLKPYYLHL